MVRFGARDYDSEMGRWLAKDPHKLADGFNIYQYSSSEPINLLDLTGLWTFSIGRYGTAGAPGIVGSGGFSLNFDGRGNISLTGTLGGGGRAGTPGATGALHIGGGGIDIGGGLGVGLDVQVTNTWEIARGDVWDLLDPWGVLPCH